VILGIARLTPAFVTASPTDAKFSAHGLASPWPSSGRARVSGFVLLACVRLVCGRARVVADELFARWRAVLAASSKPLMLLLLLLLLLLRLRMTS